MSTMDRSGPAERWGTREMSNIDQRSTATVLVVEDAPEFLQMIVPLLEREGYATSAATDGEQAVALARELMPDVIVLDLALPKLDGVEVCRQVRTFSDAYVIMLTSRSDEVDRVVGLEVGADDYMTKPFSPRELVARVRAMLRRPRTAGSGTEAGGPKVTIGRITIDAPGRTVEIDGDEINLTRIEFDLLATLAAQPSMVFSRAMLRDLVWGPDWYGDDHVVDVHIANLRKKIDGGAERSQIRTVRGVGYRMADAGA